MKTFPFTYLANTQIAAPPVTLFSYIDDHVRFSSHMSKSSWMMGGGRMEVSVDEGKGQRAGSHIRMKGLAFGMAIYVDEVVTLYDPPYIKEWETAGPPKLLVVGNYRMRVVIEAREAGSLLRISIDYELPKKHIWLGQLCGSWYARWCVHKMLSETENYFSRILGTQ